MNALHIESERKATKTVADLLTDTRRVAAIYVTQNDGSSYWVDRYRIPHWMRRNAKLPYREVEDKSCNQWHCIVSCDDFALAVIALEAR